LHTEIEQIALFSFAAKAAKIGALDAALGRAAGMPNLFEMRRAKLPLQR